jgi:DNA-binding NarL/FixJ family response regulator
MAREQGAAGTTQDRTARIKVLLIEDNRLLREGLAAMLDAEGTIEVVAVAEDGDALELLQQAGRTPDVVLLDRQRARRRRNWPRVRVRSIRRGRGP